MTNSLTPADLDALEAAIEKMTPGPWEKQKAQVVARLDPDPHNPAHLIADTGWFDDAAAICALRNAAPALIAEVRRLRKVLGAIAVDPLTLVEMHEEPLRGWAVCCAQIAADALDGGDND